MALLESWGLPEDIYLPVGNHHLNKHEGSAGLYSKIVYLANFLIERMGLLLTDPVNYNFDLQETEDIKAIMEEIPGFESNKKLIFDEFF